MTTSEEGRGMPPAPPKTTAAKPKKLFEEKPKNILPVQETPAANPRGQ